MGATDRPPSCVWPSVSGQLLLAAQIILERCVVVPEEREIEDDETAKREALFVFSSASWQVK